MQEVENEYDKIGKKLYAFLFDGQHTFKKGVIAISVGRRDLTLTYNSYYTAIDRDDFNFKKLSDIVKKDIKRLKKSWN